MDFLVIFIPKSPARNLKTSPGFQPHRINLPISFAPKCGVLEISRSYFKDIQSILSADSEEFKRLFHEELELLEKEWRNYKYKYQAWQNSFAMEKDKLDALSNQDWSFGMGAKIYS